MSCSHPVSSNYDGNLVCEHCGLHLEESLLEEQFYSNSDKGVSRHHNRKETERSLYSDLESRGFPQRIIERANEHYKQIIENKIYRSKNRLGIVFACTFEAYKDFDSPQQAGDLAKRFGLDKKGVSCGFKTFAAVFQNTRKKRHIGPIDLIPRILSELGIESQSVYIQDLIKLWDAASINNPHLKTVIPQSAAAGLVWYYLKLKNHPIQKQDFAQIVRLTEVTFTKVSDDFSRCFDWVVSV